MRLARVRFTMRRLMVVVAIATVAIAFLPEPVFVLPTSMIHPVTQASLTFWFSRLDVALAASTLSIVALTAVWLVKRLLRTARRLARPDESGEPLAVPLPRVPLTVRRMMVWVAICAVILGGVYELARRSAKFTELAARHQASIKEETFYAIGLGWGTPDRLSPRESWRLEMLGKYRHAAQYPWLPVEPDPPEPE